MKLTQKQIKKLIKGSYKKHSYDITATVDKVVLTYGFRGSKRVPIVWFSKITIAKFSSKSNITMTNIPSTYPKSLAKLGTLKHGDVISLSAKLTKYIINRQKYFYYKVVEHNTKAQLSYIKPKLCYLSKIKRIKPSQVHRLPVPTTHPVLIIGWYLTVYDIKKNKCDYEIRSSWKYYHRIYKAWVKSIADNKTFNVKSASAKINHSALKHVLNIADSPYYFYIKNHSTKARLSDAKAISKCLNYKNKRAKIRKACANYPEYLSLQALAITYRFYEYGTNGDKLIQLIKRMQEHQVYPPDINGDYKNIINSINKGVHNISNLSEVIYCIFEGIVKARHFDKDDMKFKMQDYLTEHEEKAKKSRGL